MCGLTNQYYNKKQSNQVIKTSSTKNPLGLEVFNPRGKGTVGTLQCPVFTLVVVKLQLSFLCSMEWAISVHSLSVSSL